jgi:RimJ/RimL family protein N-acetyltransferase
MIREDIKIYDELVLGSLRKKDLDQLIVLLNDPQIHKNTMTIPYPYKKEYAEFYYNRMKGWEEENGIKKEWQIRLNGEMIGGIGLGYEEGVSSHKSKIGYWIGAPYRGKGVMASVIKGFVRYIFENRPNLLRLEAYVFPDNIASQKTLEINGFFREGYFKRYYQKNKEYKDTIQYTIFNSIILS